MPRTRGFQWDNRLKQLKVRGKKVVDQENASTVNTINSAGSVSGSPVALLAEGDDTNISIRILPKGAGVVDIDNLRIIGEIGSISTIASNSNITLDPHGTGQVVLNATTQIGSGNDQLLITPSGGNGPKITTESSNADITIDTNGTGSIRLTAGADVIIPANIGLTFGTGEKIEGDNTNLTVTSGADINLTASGDVNLPNNVGLVFGDDGEKIEGDGTNLTIASSGTLNISNTGLMSVSGALQVNGNFTVLGTQSVLETTTTEIEDGLIAINSKNSGGADIDSGIHINRGSAGNNAVFYWNEGDDKFKAVLSNSASTVTAVTDSSTATIVANIEGAVTGNADTATALATARNIGGTSFDGTGDIVPGTINISANNSTDENIFLTFVDGATGAQGLETDTALTYNPNDNNLTAGKVTAGSFVTTGNAITIADNEITTGSSNADINITPHGTGTVIMDRVTIDDNTISANVSNADLELFGNGTGGVVIDQLKFEGNEVRTTESNANIVLQPSGSGVVSIGTGTVLHTANSDIPTLTSSASDLDHFLINDGGVMKRIAKNNVKLSQFSNDANFASSASTGFSSSTLASFPTDVGDSSTVDFSDGEGGGVGTGTTFDAFGISVVAVFDANEPRGQVQSSDLGTDESHVGA